MSLFVTLNSQLPAEVIGKLEASCSGISESVQISGKAIAKGLQPLVDVVDALFGEYITDDLTPVIRDALNKEIKKILPVCV